MKRIILMPFLVFLLLMNGCIFPTGKSESEKKTLLNWFSNSPVTGARFYLHDGTGNYSFDELPEEQIETLTATLESMKLRSHLFHTDYFWAGEYGIELDLEDGTYLIYDTGKLYHRSVPIRESFDSEYHLDSAFIDVTNCDFMQEMKTFFPMIEEMY